MDTTVVSGPDYVDTTSVKNTYVRNYEKTTAFLQKVKPNYIHTLPDETAEDTTTAAASSSKKKGADYHHLIRLRHGDRGEACEEGVTTHTTAWRALQRRVRQATYRLITQESATTIGQTTVYVWRTLQQHRSVHYDRMVRSLLH